MTNVSKKSEAIILGTLTHDKWKTADAIIRECCYSYPHVNRALNKGIEDGVVIRRKKRKSRQLMYKLNDAPCNEPQEAQDSSVVDEIGESSVVVQIEVGLSRAFWIIAGLVLAGYLAAAIFAVSFVVKTLS